MPLRSRLATALVIIAAAALLIWLRPGSRPLDSHPQGHPAAPSGRGTPPPSGEIRSAVSSPGVDPTNTDPRFTRFTNGSIHLKSSITASQGLHQSIDPRSDLGIIEQVIAEYRLIYRENPVGTENSEIVAQLLGGNPKKVFFLDPGLAALNGDRELLDRWGSPFIFHPLKADLMDIRSLGPDRKPWTEDDLTLGLEDTEAELQLNPQPHP